MTLVDDYETGVRDDGILDAVMAHDTAKIFDWLLTSFSYQGISDSVASHYMDQHGTASWSDIRSRLARSPSCQLLRSYWHYAGCGYNKTSGCCSEPEYFEHCPVPKHRLRNGRLNQTAYSFFLFIRDIAKGDIVRWIDDQLGAEVASSIVRLEQRLIEPLRNVYGISDKILTMSLSGLLLGAASVRPRWFEVGKSMIVIDTLVHNFLHRTGILDDFHASHLYGPGCYASGGCADIVRQLSASIDARQFNPRFPQDFPRFVQKAIWQFCSASHLNICNGNRIDDRKPCEVAYCQLFRRCGRKQLKTNKTQ